MKVGEVLGVIDESPSGRGRRGAAAAPAPPKAAERRRKRSRREPRARRRATPTARNAAQQNEVDLAQVRGSGDAGRVMRRDVEQAARSLAATAAPRIRPTSRTSAPRRAAAGETGAARRQTIAASRRRAHRGARPHVEAPRDDRAAARRGAEHRGDADHLQRGGHDGGDGAARAAQAVVQGAPRRRSRLPSFFVKAAIGALREFPRINAEIQGDEMVLKHYYDIGIAVGAAEGLVVPVLRDADRMSFAQIEQADPRVRRKRRRTARSRSTDLQGRHLHHHQRRRLRLAPEHADPQPAAGRHPRPARDQGTPRRPSTARSWFAR